MVWCCTEKSKCKWQAFALHQGLAWGEVPGKDNPWRQFHDVECPGKLVNLFDDKALDGKVLGKEAKKE